MARFDLKFLCTSGGDDFIKANIDLDDGTVDITGECNGATFEIYLDKSTAIKFAKTLRTEINKIES